MAKMSDVEYQLWQLDDKRRFWREQYHDSMRAWSQMILEVEGWADRHAQHAGHAPLSELRAILRGGDEEVHPVVPSP